MSRIGQKLIHPIQNEFKDLAKDEIEKFPALTVRLETIDSLLLLLDTKEEMALVSIFQHITDYVRKHDENLALLREKNVLELMLHKEFFRLSESVIVRRFSLCLAAHMAENMNTLVDLETPRTLEIIRVCLACYVREEDEFCLEYLSCVINKCLDDPQAVKRVLEDIHFVEKFFNAAAVSSNPDVVLYSFELLEKMLRVPCSKELQNFTDHTSFPMGRILCELTSKFPQIRSAALKVLRLLILETSACRPLTIGSRKSSVLEQLTNMFCEHLRPPELQLVVEALAAALRQEDFAQLFFKLNYFERYVAHLNDSQSLELENLSHVLVVLSEAAKYSEYLPRLVKADVIEKLLDCLLADDNKEPMHLLVGLNRMLANPEASKRMVEAFERGVIAKLLVLVGDVETNLKTREVAAELLLNLLAHAYHRAAGEMLKLDVSLVLAKTFGQEGQYLSVDLISTLLKIIESLAANDDCRETICGNPALVTNIGILLMNSFSHTIVVDHIFRCLCTIIEEEPVRVALLRCYLISSIKRALNSLSNFVKISVTNFIMQTARFTEFVGEYIDHGVLEVLIMHQSLASCVPTWSPAIESILSKTPTLKFCIRNHLGFTDVTTGHDWFVSKSKFKDFRLFQAMLKEDVSPLHPILVVNFERPTTPEEMIVKVPRDCLTREDCRSLAEPSEWCYCRTPGDSYLPRYLQEVLVRMEAEDLAVQAANQNCGIDFENLAKRVKVIAQVVAHELGNNLKLLDLNADEECSLHTVQCHLKELARTLHCTFIPLGHIRSGCHFERAVLFKALADQVGLPCTLQRSVDGQMLYNKVPLALEMESDTHCDPMTLKFMPWRMLRPTAIVDLMYNVGELYPMQSRQALQYLRLY